MPNSPGPLHILIIDDDEDALELTCALIRKASPDSTISVACGARAGLDYLLSATNPAGNLAAVPDLVLLDINMPGMSGFDVLRWIRYNQSLADVKVVMLSSSEEKADINRATELGAHGYLIKYPNPSCLAGLLKQVLDLVLGLRAPPAVTSEGEASAGMLRHRSGT